MSDAPPPVPAAGIGTDRTVGWRGSRVPCTLFVILDDKELEEFDAVLALPDRKPYYTPAEIAALAQVDPKTVMTWIHSGKVGVVQLSARIYRIPLAAAIKLLAPDDVRHPRIGRRSVARIARPTDAAIRRRRPAARV